MTGDCLVAFFIPSVYYSHLSKDPVLNINTSNVVNTIVCFKEKCLVKSNLSSGR